MKRAIMPIVVLVALLLAGCTANVGLVPPEQMAPKELATYAMRVYNQQFDDYMAKASLPNLSGAEKTILRAKKEWIDGAWPVIKTYNYYIDQSQYPPAELQKQVLVWLNSVRY